ncbi:MAG: L-serine ammonia-lyase, iron-sulfur-dependent, subunit alpha [bacterium]
MKNNKEILELLKKELVLALGCTEPIAVALAAAYAKRAINTEPDLIEVNLSGNVLKNGMGVGIPGTNLIGLSIAAALGVIGGSADAQLEVLKDISEEDINIAKLYVEQGKVIVKESKNSDKLYIEVICRKENHYGRVVIKGTHTNVILIEHDNKIIFNRKEQSGFVVKNNERFKEIKLTVDEIYSFATKIPLEEIEFILGYADINMALAKEGVREGYGLHVGKTMMQNIEKGLMGNDVTNRAMALSSGASDARMSGCCLPAVANSGSGNQGITIMVPILVYAEYLKVNREKLARALVLGNLISIHIKTHLGRLAALCGVVIAATGASSGITYLSRGDLEKIKAAIKNMAGNISGMFCDGAKPGCAMKVATSVNAAMQSAILAINNRVISEAEGIIADDVEDTIVNLAKLGSEGMLETDKMILEIMVCK